MSIDGVIWTVRYYNQDDGVIKNILAREIDRILNEMEADGKDWTSADLADQLITDLDARPSGAGELAVTPERVNLAVGALGSPDFGEMELPDVVRTVLRADQDGRAKAQREKREAAARLAKSKKEQD